jgi:cbb3-type cytochrome oxidase subunit 3
VTAALEQLRDIRGLDPAPGWPFTLGGWLLMVIVGALFCVAGVVFFYRRRRRARARWRKEAALVLRQLRLRLDRISAQEAAGELGELLRRVAMAYNGRRACAGLVGEAWLAWLEAHDPDGFPWRREGRCLLELPYAPRGRESPPAAQLAPLIGAAEAWLNKPPASL